METLVEQPTLEAEKQKSFDPLASVNIARYDLINFGRILPESRQRIRDEELTVIVEGAGRASRTSFILQRQDSELVYFDKGQWTPYRNSLMTGLRVAQNEAKEDPKTQFLADRAADDIYNGNIINTLKPGEQHAWYSPYPENEANLYGAKFIKDRGFQPERRMGFLYRAKCLDDGSVLLESQTVDRSDQDAFDAVMAATEYDPEIDMETMLRVYDGSLLKKYGQKFRAGRTHEEAQNDAWEAINQAEDLVYVHLSEIEQAAENSLNVPEDRLGAIFGEAIKHNLYSTWAAFKKRLNGTAWQPKASFVDAQQFSVDSTQTDGHFAYWRVMQEKRYALNDFVEKGEVMSGCGGSIKAISNKGNLFTSPVGDVFDAIFSGSSEKSSEKEGYNFNKKMYCVVCQAPPKKHEAKKDCGPCGLCRKCDKDAGGDG